MIGDDERTNDTMIAFNQTPINGSTSLVHSHRMFRCCQSMNALHERGRSRTSRMKQDMNIQSFLFDPFFRPKPSPSSNCGTQKDPPPPCCSLLNSIQPPQTLILNAPSSIRKFETSQCFMISQSFINQSFKIVSALHNRPSKVPIDDKPPTSLLNGCIQRRRSKNKTPPSQASSKLP
jgi:hypothetical protein